MQFLRWLSILLLSGYSTFMSGQPLWRLYAPQAFVNVEREVNDSIKHLRVKSDTLRARMNRIIPAEGLDRMAIAGENDRYIKEGMHKHFSRAPGPMQGNYERNAQIQLLENLHVELYQTDEQLFRWLQFNATLRQHPNRTSYDRWTTLWTELDEKKRPTKQADIISWLSDQLVCDLISDVQPTVARNPFEKMRRFTPEPEEPHKGYGTTEDWVLPISPEQFIASFPMNGQFAFDREEPLPQTGYVMLPSSFQWKMRTTTFQDNNFFWARWSSHTGEVKYTLAEWRESGFFFDLPDTLLPGKIYQLELIAMAEGFSRTDEDNEKCWVEMRETNTRQKSSTKSRPKNETLITTIYFRAGINDHRERLHWSNANIDWEEGTITYKTIDPYDPLEIFGTNAHKPAVTFTIENFSLYDLVSALNSKALFYYLSVPIIEDYASITLDSMLTAESDHTAQAPFLRKTGLGDASNYIKLAENRPLAVPIQNNYVAPAYLTYNAPDSISTSVPIPKITKEHFLQKQKWPTDSITYTVYLGEMKLFNEALLLQQKQLRHRIESRAAFFYALDQRAAQRQGQTFPATPEEYMAIEKSNIPTDVSRVLNAKLPDALQNGFAILYNRFFPGTKQMCSSLRIILD